LEVQLLEKERDRETLAYKHSHNKRAGEHQHKKMRLCKALLVLATLASVVSSAAVIRRDEGGGKLPRPAPRKVARKEPGDTKHFREFFFGDPKFFCHQGTDISSGLKMNLG